MCSRRFFVLASGFSYSRFFGSGFSCSRFAVRGGVGDGLPSGR